MATEIQKNELLEQFQSYLQLNSLDSFASDGQPDLNTLLSELTGLKSEVKAESRLFKSTLDTLSSALISVQDDNKVLADQLEESDQRLERQQDETVRAMLLEFIDVYDRITTGIEVLQNYRPVDTLFKSSRQRDIDFIKGFGEGQLMLLKRFDQLLQKYQVRIIDSVGKKLDPTTMSAIETTSDKRIENGMVVEELRTGFLYKNKVLRLAEVKVNSVKIV